jgi:hypothetical protein
MVLHKLVLLGRCTKRCAFYEAAILQDRPLRESATDPAPPCASYFFLSFLYARYLTEWVRVVDRRFVSKSFEFG